jgi:hypothetical protein
VAESRRSLTRDHHQPQSGSRRACVLERARERERGRAREREQERERERERERGNYRYWPLTRLSLHQTVFFPSCLLPPPPFAVSSPVDVSGACARGPRFSTAEKELRPSADRLPAARQRGTGARGTPRQRPAAPPNAVRADIGATEPPFFVTVRFFFGGRKKVQRRNKAVSLVPVRVRYGQSSTERRKNNKREPESDLTVRHAKVTLSKKCLSATGSQPTVIAFTVSFPFETLIPELERRTGIRTQEELRDKRTFRRSTTSRSLNAASV